MKETKGSGPVRVVVEGQTEESFVHHVLAPYFWEREIYLTAILLGHPGRPGGRPNYARVKRDVLLHLKQDGASYCSTMLDLYGLGSGFPGMPLPAGLAGTEKATRIENAIEADIRSAVPELRPDRRFLPYLQVHEFEALLFSAPAEFAASIHEPALASQLGKIRESFGTPEDIHDGPQTAPSKRVISAYPAYRKVLHGTLAATAIGRHRG